jgi:hypothetical protein
MSDREEYELWRVFLPACKEWCSLMPDGGLVFDPAEWAPVEFALHELAHAHLLGISPPPAELSDAVTSALTSWTEPEQASHEMLVWSLEYVVANAIGIPMEVGDVVDAAEIQGVSASEMEITLMQAPLMWIPSATIVIGSLKRWAIAIQKELT